MMCQQLLVSAKKSFSNNFDVDVVSGLKETNSSLEKKVSRLSSQLAAIEASNIQLISAAATFETQKTLLEDVRI